MFRKTLRPDVVVVGAGLIGISAAMQLGQKGLSVLVVDERPISSLTSAVSTEAYRNFWPGSQTLTGLMNRSIDLMDKWSKDSQNVFQMTQRGYLFASVNKSQHLATAEAYRSLHVTPDDCNLNYSTSCDYDVVVAQDETVAQYAPFLSDNIQSVLHARRCGWISAHLLVAYMKEQCDGGNVQFLRGAVTSVQLEMNRISGVHVQVNNDRLDIPCSALVNAAGPFLANVHRMVDPSTDLKVTNVVHGKVVMRDLLSVLPDQCPMLILDDKVLLGWTDEERQSLMEMDESYRRLADLLPSGAHLRPYGDRHMLLLWDFMHTDQFVAEPPTESIEFSRLYPEIVLRGLSNILPGLETYASCIPSATYIDGGYYTKSCDGLPIVGHWDPVNGYYLAGGLGGYGVMASAAVGEIISNTVTCSDSIHDPSYAKAIKPSRSTSTCGQEVVLNL